MYVMDTKIDSKLDSLRDHLCNLVYQYLNKSDIKITSRKRTAIKSSCSAFILNTFYKVERGIHLCGVTLDRNHYSKTAIVNGRAVNRKVSYQYTRVLFDCLQSLGMVTLNKGEPVYGIMNGVWSTVDFESGFIEMHKPLIALYKSINYEFTEKQLQRVNVIIVRNEDGVDVTYRMNDKLRMDKTLLDGFNVLSLSHEVAIQDVIYDVQLCKIYNSKTYDKGARNFMTGEGIQCLSKEERLKLTINGNQTVVFDYKAFEPSIAYSMVHEKMQGDPYTITLDGYDASTLRDICKVFLLVMFNLDDEKYLIQTLNSAIRTEFDVAELYDQGKIPDKRIDVKTILDKLESKHYLIRHMFYGNFHTQPSYLGSLIADYITDYFTQRGILVLSVFDEFIIEEEHEDELKEVLVRGYEMILGSSYNCNIVKEK